MSKSLLSDAGYISEDDQMDTEDDPRKSEDALLDTDDNGDTNPGQTLPQKQEYGETNPQKEETSRISDKEQSRKRRHSKISTLPAEERMKKAEKAIEGLKRHTDKRNLPSIFPIQDTSKC